MDELKFKSGRRRTSAEDLFRVRQPPEPQAAKPLPTSTLLESARKKADAVNRLLRSVADGLLDSQMKIAETRIDEAAAAGLYKCTIHFVRLPEPHEHSLILREHLAKGFSRILTNNGFQVSRAGGAANVDISWG